MSAPITEPCVIDGMDDATYHADPVLGGSLSSTGAKNILRSPALYQWRRTHRAEKVAYDVGHAAHAKILGVGMGVVVYPDEHLTPSGNISTKAATVAWVDEQRAAGLVPVTPDQVSAVDAMAESVLAYPPARALLERPGKSEQSLFAPDPDTGVWLRARIDRLPDVGTDPVAIDLKTSDDASPEGFARSVAKYGYDVQQAFYLHALRLTRGDDADFRFVVVEKNAPYLPAVHQLDDEFAAIGRLRMRRAIDTYAACVAADKWPGYEPVVHFIGAPRWLAYEEGMVL